MILYIIYIDDALNPLHYQAIGPQVLQETLKWEIQFPNDSPKPKLEFRQSKDIRIISLVYILRRLPNLQSPSLSQICYVEYHYHKFVMVPTRSCEGITCAFNGSSADQLPLMQTLRTHGNVFIRGYLGSSRVLALWAWIVGAYCIIYIYKSMLILTKKKVNAYFLLNIIHTCIYLFLLFCINNQLCSLNFESKQIKICSPKKKIKINFTGEN